MSSGPHLPEVQTQNPDAVELVDVCVWAVFGVIDFWMHPGSFVVWIIDLFGLPFSLRSQERSEGDGLSRSTRPRRRAGGLTLYSGLLIIGGSHSPSMSSCQSSGFLASGSGMYSGFSQSCGNKYCLVGPSDQDSVKLLQLKVFTSGLVSSGSSIFGRSSQSSGFLASGSLIFLGGRKSQSSSRLPDSTFSLSILTW